MRKKYLAFDASVIIKGENNDVFGKLVRKINHSNLTSDMVELTTGV